MTGRLVAAAVSFALTFASIAGEPPRAAVIGAAEREGVVELVSIDRAARVAVFRGPTDVALAITLPAEAKNLDRVKPGDRFVLRYLEAVAVALHKGGAASASDLRTVMLAPKGGTPGGAVVDTKQVTALVTAVNRAQRTLVLQGSQRNAMTFKVADEVRSFDDIAVGDTVGITYTEALMIELIPDTSR
jgi:hypothetical protein